MVQGLVCLYLIAKHPIYYEVPLAHHTQLHGNFHVAVQILQLTLMHMGVHIPTYLRHGLTRKRLMAVFPEKLTHQRSQ